MRPRRVSGSELKPTSHGLLRPTVPLVFLRVPLRHRSLRFPLRSSPTPYVLGSRGLTPCRSLTASWTLEETFPTTVATSTDTVNLSTIRIQDCFGKETLALQIVQELNTPIASQIHHFFTL